jgi:transcriptional regulatory protein RtcR
LHSSDWQSDCQSICAEFLSASQVQELDLFDQLQLAQVLQICKQATSLAEAGRTLFAQSRLRKSAANDSHRLKQYLAKYQLEFQQIKAAMMS